MKSMFKTASRFLGAVTLLSLVSSYAFADTCVINRNSTTNPPIGWNHGDYVTTPKSSIYNPEACNVSGSNEITSVRFSFNAVANRRHLTAGLLHGDYYLQVSANGVNDSVRAIVGTSGLNSIGTSKTSNAFNGMDLSDFNMSIVGSLQGATSLRCRNNSNPNDCRNYMYYTYSIHVDYESTDVPPAAPASVSATLWNDDITISWSSVSSAAWYEREVSLQGAAYQNTKVYNAPQTSVTFFDQQARTYRYRVRACNDFGCSPWQYSNTITISTVPPAPASFSAAVISADDIRITWSRVSLANYYNREVRINGGSWINTKKYYAPLTSYTMFDQQPRTYQYRLRSCNAAAQCSGWVTSNTVTIN